jgi:predicted nucleic acid-binding protein
MSGFVVDASAALSGCFQDEATAASNMLLARLKSGEPTVVPGHWLTEVGNGLLMATRRGRIPLADVDLFLVSLGLLFVGIEQISLHQLRDRVLPLANSQNWTLYDAAYLELAQRRGLPLATRDTPLARAANNIGVMLL